MIRIILKIPPFWWNMYMHRHMMHGCTRNFYALPYTLTHTHTCIYISMSGCTEISHVFSIKSAL